MVQEEFRRRKAAGGRMQSVSILSGRIVCENCGGFYGRKAWHSASEKYRASEKAKAQLEQLRATKAAREAQTEAIGAFMFEVQEMDVLTEFDEKLWLTIIDTVTVHADGQMTFKFQGGKTLTSY